MTEEQTRIKELFGMVLDAEEEAASGEPSANPAEANAALAAAPPHVRDAVDRLMKAHRRARGVLLEESHSRIDRPSLGGAAVGAGRPHGAKSGGIDGPLMQPPQITGYEVGEELGRGGFGVVYRARQLHPVERPVAIKILRTEFASQEAVARFRAESRMLARMNHPGIARVLDAGVDAMHRPFVAMELIEGRPIAAYCEGANLPVRQRVRLMADVCHGVHHAHQRMVIHRDLKPANILVEQVDGQARPRVIDFGIAKILEEEGNEAHTMTGARLGTPKYMSPEQADGAAFDDVRTDVYALGVVLCEVLTGMVPRDRSGPASGSGSRNTTRATRPSELAAKGDGAVASRSSELRGDLDRIVLKAVAIEPELRYESAAALAEDLERYLDGRPVLATPPSVMYLTRKFIARNKFISAAALLAVVSLIGGTAAAMYGMNRANESRIIAEQQTIRAEYEAVVATEINEFWLDIIRRGSPSEARRPDLQVREALDMAAPSLADQIPDPQVRRQLHTTFANAYQTLGVREAQLHHAREAWELWEQSDETDELERVTLQTALGDALVEMRRLDEARPLLAEAREVCESGDGALRKHLPLVLQTLSRLAHAEGDLPLTESLLAEAVEVAEAELGPRHVLTMANIKQLALAQVQAGRNQEALEHLEPLLEMQREQLGPRHPELISTRTTLVHVRQNLGRYDEAERDYLDLLALAPQVLGEDHYYVTILKNNYASLLRELKRHAEAEALFRETYEARLRTDGPDHPSTFQSMVNLAMSMISQGMWEESVPLLQQAVDGRQRVLGLDHPDTLNAQQVLASVYHRTGRPEDAVTQFALLLEQYRQAFPPGHIRFAPLLRNYGLALVDLGRHEDAMPLLIESYEVQHAAAGPDHPQTHRAIEFICSTLAALDSPDHYAQWSERCAASGQADSR